MTNPPQDRDIFHQTFTHHWAACRCQTTPPPLLLLLLLLLLFLPIFLCFSPCLTHRNSIRNFEPLSEQVQDDILTVTAQLEQVGIFFTPSPHLHPLTLSSPHLHASSPQMLQLLQLELAGCRQGGEGGSSILDMVLSDSDNILAQVTTDTPEDNHTYNTTLEHTLSLASM